jgi:hypothetical protein
MTYKKLNSTQLHLAAIYYAAAEATRHGYDVTLLGENRRTRLQVDGHLCEVFGRTTPWRMRKATQQELRSGTNFAIFVHLADDKPKFFVVPAADSDRDIEAWAGRWDLLD